jgi:hypothetical protein
MPTNNRFLKVSGGFEREQTIPRQLTPSEIQQYYASEGNKANPLSPLDFISQQTRIPASPQGDGSPLLPGETQTTQAPAVSQNPYDNFNLLLLDALKKAQGVDTSELLKRRRELQRASIGRASEITPEGLRTLSPEQQELIRSGKVSALRPDIDENAFQLERANQQIANFERVFSEASKLGEEFKKNMVAPDSVIQSYKKAIEANPDNLSTLLSGLNDKNRQAVIGALDYTQLKKKEKEPTQTEKDRTLREQVISLATPILENSKGSDGYVNADAYMDLRRQYFEKFGNTSGFDSLFQHMMNPVDKERLGIGRIGTIGSDSGGINISSEAIQNALNSE